jgi:hypothetical protein
VIVDSYGLLSLCVDRGSAALELRIAAGDEVRLERVEDSAADGGVDIPIALRKRGSAS